MQGMCVGICSIEQASLAEWLRRWPAKPLCIARAGSYPAASLLRMGSFDIELFIDSRRLAVI